MSYFQGWVLILVAVVYVGLKAWDTYRCWKEFGDDPSNEFEFGDTLDFEGSGACCPESISE